MKSKLKLELIYVGGNGY